MYLSVKGNQLEAVRFLLARRVPIHYERPEKVENSPIFYAIRQNNLAVIELFCDQNTEQLNYTVDSKASNTIMYAAECANFDAVNYLSIRGVHLDVEDREGKSLLFRALMAEKYDLATKLLQRGATVNYQNKEG